MVLAAAVVACLASAAPLEKLRVGALVTDTGRFSSYAEDYRTSFTLWEEWVAEQGGLEIGGRRYEVEMVYSDVGDTSEKKIGFPTLKEKVREMANGTFGHIDYYFAPYSSTLSPVALETLHRLGSKAVMIAPTAASDTVWVCDDRLLYPCTSANRRRFARGWSMATPATQYLPTNIVVASIKAVKRVAIVYENLAFPRGTCRGATETMKVYGMENVFEYSIEQADNETAYDVARKLREVDPDYVVGCVYNNFCFMFVDALKGIGYTPKGAGLTSCITSAGLTLGRENEAQYLTGPTAWHPKLAGVDFSSTAEANVPLFVPKEGDSSSMQYNTMFTEKLGRPPTYQAAQGMTAAIALTSALLMANSTDPDHVNAAMREVYEPSFYGRLSFDSYGRAKGSMLSLQLDQHTERQIVAPLSAASMSMVYPAPTYAQRTCLAAAMCGERGSCGAAGQCVCEPGWEGRDCRAEVVEKSVMEEYGVIVLPIVGGLVLVMAALTAYVLHQRSQALKMKEMTKHAPRGGPVTLLFTDIKKSSDLWGEYPSEMEAALATHHAIARALLAKYAGYEVKTIGDAFMCAFESPVNAMRWSLAFQRDLLAAEWPAALGNHPAASEQKDSRGRVVFRGLRVRVGVHTGHVNVRQTPQGGYDYEGAEVNITARVSDSGAGGQVLMTQAMYSAIEPFLDDLECAAEVAHLGQFRFKGIDEALAVYSIIREELQERDFEPIRGATAVEGAAAAAADPTNPDLSRQPSCGDSCANSAQQFVALQTIRKWVSRFGRGGVAALDLAGVLKTGCDGVGLTETIVVSTMIQKWYDGLGKGSTRRAVADVAGSVSSPHGSSFRGTGSVLGSEVGRVDITVGAPHGRRVAPAAAAEGYAAPAGLRWPAVSAILQTFPGKSIIAIAQALQDERAESGITPGGLTGGLTPNEIQFTA